MPRRTLALIAICIVSCGCISGGRTGAVPDWIGIPTNVIAPNSLEAETWRRDHYAPAIPPSAMLGAPHPGLPGGYGAPLTR